MVKLNDVKPEGGAVVRFDVLGLQSDVLLVLSRHCPQSFDISLKLAGVQAEIFLSQNRAPIEKVIDVRDSSRVVPAIRKVAWYEAKRLSCTVGVEKRRK